MKYRTHAKIVGLALFGVLFFNARSDGQTTHSKLAEEMLTLAQQKGQKVYIEFNDPRRFEWRRTPGMRNGVALYEMDFQQKKILHQMLSLALSTSGYNKVSHVLFNEDLSKEFDPETGHNKYWLAIYGKPSTKTTWGWRLEGHHLSMNFTLEGDTLVSSTPFELGSFPAVIEKDAYRAGFRNLSKEIDLGFELIGSLNPGQRAKAIIQKTMPNEKMMGEINVIAAKKQVGLPFQEMNKRQQAIVLRLVKEYTGNIETAPAIDLSSLRFAWWGAADNSQPYAYRLHGKDFLIDFEDIGNHVHCVWRALKKDFGNNPFGN
jgi:hypothetical protein